MLGNFIFKKASGEVVSNTIAYINDQIAKDKYLKILVGCDSQNKRYNTCYITVIVLRFGNRGADFIYWKENVKKIWNKEKKVAVNQRLWGEVERSLAVAIKLRDGGVPVYCVDLDLNDEQGTGSNSLAASGRGYIVSEGFQCSIKPEQQVASRAADHLVRV